jgi:hypothetical protein
MTFPDWAPPQLITLHSRQVASDLKEFDPEEYIAELRKDEKWKNKPEQFFDKIKEHHYRKTLFLNKKESIPLLEKILTDPRMRAVWLSLDRRRKSDGDELKFWWTCQSAIVGWRGEPKITPKEKKQILVDVIDSVKKLRSAIERIREFDFYSTTSLIEDREIEWLIEVLDATMVHQNNEAEFLSYVRFSLSEVVPHYQTILSDIEIKAGSFLSEELLVKKPNSENASLHYFVRTISQWFRDYHGQPLHDAVAITASVIFDEDDLDADYVRKLVTTSPPFFNPQK